MRLSVFMIVLNEEKRIRASLEAASFADEVVVVDGGSQDRTVEIARAMATRVHERPFRDFGDQKNYAMDLCTGDWLLSLDADEVLTPELTNEIRQVLMSSPKEGSFRIHRKSRMFGQWMKYTGTQNDKPVRLFKKGQARFSGTIHETLTVLGATGQLRHPMLHTTYDNLTQYVERFNRYTSAEAKAMFAKGYRPGFLDLWVKPWAQMVRLYFFEKGFLDGTAGLAFSLMSGFYILVKHLKCMEQRIVQGR